MLVSLSGTHDVCSSLLSTCRIVLSTPLAVICYFLIFYVPPFEDGKVVWYLFFYCAFQTLQTVSIHPLDPGTDFHCHSKYSDLNTLMLYVNTNMTWLAKKLLSGSLLHIAWMNFTTESLVMSVNYTYCKSTHRCTLESLRALISGIYTLKWKNLNFSFKPLSVDSVSSLTFSWISTFQCFHVPYSALTMFISSEQSERDSATAYSEYHCSRVKCECPVLPHMAKLLYALPSLQGWRSRFWALCSVQPSRGRSSAWPALPAYQDLVTPS